MKKIIATVLAMVMALALCTTAFAYNSDDKFDVYAASSDNMKDSSTVNTGKTPATGLKGVTMGFVAATSASNGSGTIEYINFDVEHATAQSTKYVKTTKPLATDFAVTEAGKTAVLFYVTTVTDTAYDFTAKEFTNFGLNCGQINKSASNENDYYVDNDGTVYASASDATNTKPTAKKALVDGSVKTVYEVNKTTVKGTADQVLSHVYYMTASTIDGTKIVPTAVACQNCGDKSTELYKTTKLPAGKSDTYKITVSGTEYVVIPSGTGSTTGTTTGTTTSPKTFDAGIAMYVGMALTSVAGSAVVIGKKKEF